MQRNLSKWLTVFILVTSTLNRPATSKRNILDDLLFMMLNQVDRETMSRLDISKLKDSGLKSDLMRLFDPKPRQVTGLKLPINPMPFNRMHMTKIMFAFTPINIDVIIEQTQAANNFANTMLLGYDGVAHFMHQYGGAVIEHLIDGGRPFNALTLNTTKTQTPIPKRKTKVKPMQTIISNMVIKAGVDTVLTSIGNYFSKPKESSTKALGRPTVRPKETSKLREEIASNIATEKDCQAQKTFPGASDKGSSEATKTDTKTGNKVLKQHETLVTTKNDSQFAFVNPFENKRKSKPTIEDEKKPSMPPSMSEMTATKGTKSTCSPEVDDDRVTPTLTTPDTAMFPEFDPDDFMIPDYAPDNIMTPEMTTELPLIPDSESDTLEQTRKNESTSNSGSKMTTNSFGEFLKTVFGKK